MAKGPIKPKLPKQPVAAKPANGGRRQASPKRTKGPAQNAPQSPGTGERPNDIYGDLSKLNDVSGAIGAQKEYNDLQLRQQEGANRYTQQNPYGTQNWTTDANGNKVLNTQLSDAEQYKLSNQNKLSQGAGDFGNQQFQQLTQQYNQPLNYDDIKNDPRNLDFSGERQKAQQSIYDEFQRQNQPRFDKEEANFQQSMADQGIAPGNEKYNFLHKQLEDQHQSARQGAQAQASQMSGQEMSNMYGIANQARNQAIGEKQGLRQNPFQELGNVLSLRSPVNNPQFQQQGDLNVSPVDVGQIAGNYSQLGFEKSKMLNANEQAALDRQNQLRAAAIGRAPGQVQYSPEQYAAANYGTWQKQQDYLQGIKKQNEPNQWTQAGSQFLGSVGSGLAQAGSKYLFGE